jgi:bifunctional DNA-binding transcriptional regulator/antitoxin component of YhaV-PrlF toxin-antitoxin module
MGPTRSRLGKTLALPIRHVDSTGRITLPHKVRRMLGISTNNTFTVDVANGAIVMRPAGDPPCPHCAGTGLQEFNDGDL